jgi:hypothetical protein
MIESRPDLFVLLDPGSPLAHMPSWPAHVRAEYEVALRAAGVAMAPHIALAEAHPPWPSRDFEPHSPTSLERMDASLLALWAKAAGDHRLRASIAVALRESEEIRRLVSEAFPETAADL